MPPASALRRRSVDATSILVAGLLSSLLAILAACPTPTPPEPIDLGGLTLRLWQPPSFANTGVDLYADAEARELDVILDGVATTHSLDGDTLEAIEAPPDGADVALVLRTTGTFGTALARTNTVRLEPGATPPPLTAFLAPPGLHALDTLLPDARDGAAACGDGLGRALLVGGEAGGALAFGSYEVDPDARSVAEGPGLPVRRRDAECVLVGESAWLVGGCTADATPVPYLQRATGNAFTTEGSQPAADVSCGASVTRTTEGFAIVAGNAVEERDETGAVLRSTSLGGDAAFASLAQSEDGAILIAGADGVSAGLAVTSSNEVVSRPELDEESLLTTRDGEAVAFFAGRIAGITADGPGDTYVEAAWIDAPGGFEASQILPLPGDRFALLPEAGDVLLDVGPDTRTFPLTPARPGARMVAGPGRTVLVLGGEATGAWVYVSEE